MRVNSGVAYGQGTLADGIRSRVIHGVNGLSVHVLEAGYDRGPRPLVVLLHGFPELAYSWRKQLLPLAEAGFHVVAPDQRGYGRTIGWDGEYDGDVGSFRLLNLAKDVFALVSALGYRTVAAVVGHDFGSPVAAYSALIRPDVFRSVVLMSAPFAGPPQLPFDTAGAQQHTNPLDKTQEERVLDELAALPRPRKHYQWYYSTPEANGDMHRSELGLRNFLRAYFHVKSADWTENEPFPLASWSAGELAKLPTYYIMDRDQNMVENVAPYLPAPGARAACRWLTEDELEVYVTEFTRTGFQGGLQWYRCRTTLGLSDDLQIFSGRTIDVPSCFIAGAHDWGMYQSPGAFERMKDGVCTQMLGTHVVTGAGHWVQQEQAGATTELLLGFLQRVG